MDLIILFAYCFPVMRAVAIVGGRVPPVSQHSRLINFVLFPPRRLATALSTSVPPPSLTGFEETWMSS